MRGRINSRRKWNFPVRFGRKVGKIGPLTFIKLNPFVKIPNRFLLKVLNFKILRLSNKYFRFFNEEERPYKLPI